MSGSDAAETIGPTEAPVSRGERYWPELDGLRAVAVLIVIAVHTKLPGFSGGSIGVDLFFTLSGFLITTVLLEEFQQRGTFSLPRFYLRRVLRLYPAMLFALLGAVALALLVGGYQQRRTLTGVPLALTYSLNWFASRGQKYELITHMWSLCVEEQFYLVWPLILLAAIKRASAQRSLSLWLSWSRSSRSRQHSS